MSQWIHASRNVRELLCKPHALPVYCQTYCVEASSSPFGLNAAAIVDLGVGVRSQYVAEHRLKKSPSTQSPKAW